MIWQKDNHIQLSLSDMTAIEFPEVNAHMGKGQEEYETLPAFFNSDDGSVTFCFQLNKEELEEINKTGCIYFKQVTFGKAMQPVCMSTQKEDLIQQ